jgi:putative SOS response-associated peptidase YedK
VKPLLWGLVPSWAKDEKIGAKMINTRAETVASKPAFRNAFNQEASLPGPASGYLECRVEEGGKRPYFIRDRARHLLMFAGCGTSGGRRQGQCGPEPSPSSPTSF